MDGFRIIARGQEPAIGGPGQGKYAGLMTRVFLD
jgi:hypothetical protein